ncbi:MAG: YraN family protein [candidate division KSB1 bacterium]|nr:YraN family protein [candidate division KSB1 bacterium]
MTASNSKKTGTQGEALAAEYLERKGYDIQERNYHGAGGEIDIICRDRDVLVFIEVKSRKSKSFGDPLEWVNARKQERIGETANEYMSRQENELDCRFDIVTVDLSCMQIEHFENAFWLE